MSRTTLRVLLSAAVDPGDTFNVAYLSGQAAADFEAQTVAMEVYGGQVTGLVTSFGVSAATITWPADAEYALPIGEYYIDFDLVGTDTPGVALNVAEMTDSTTGTPATTLAAIGAVTNLTDSSGGTPGATLAAVTTPADLTDSTGGTPGATLAAISVAVTGVDGAGSNAASKADVDSVLAVIRDAIASVNAKVNANNTAIATIRDHVASLNAKISALNTNSTAVRAAVPSLNAQCNRITDALIDAGLMAAE